MIDIVSLSKPEIEKYVLSIGEKKYRASQIYDYINKGIRSFEDMSTLPKALRSKLEEDFDIYKPEVVSKQESSDGTIKFLWKLRDGNAVETVVMRYKYGNTVCISTQIGCRQGCAFCASTIGGLVRCLTPAEMLDEVLFSQYESKQNISNIVLMGIGEPLDNFDNVVEFLKLVNSEDGMNIGMRHITISTCGITEKFDNLADLNYQFTLAVSLHAPDDETRSKLMPANRGRGVDTLISKCEEYYKKTGRRITFEYALIDKVNDNAFQAKLLSVYAKKLNAHINLIPLNYVSERDLMPSSDERIKEFTGILDKNGVNYTLRRKLGGDLNASCGQLRRQYIAP